MKVVIDDIYASDDIVIRIYDKFYDTHFIGDGLLEGFDWLVNDIGARIFLMA